jgi:hypothetical protein
MLKTIDLNKATRAEFETECERFTGDLAQSLPKDITSIIENGSKNLSI